MSAKDRREREKAATRQRILDGARELLVAEGMDGVTMRRLADRIEYSPTAIYVHFADKEALLTELCVCDFRSFTEQFAWVPRELPPVKRLWTLGQAYVRFALENPAQYRHLFLTVRTLSPEALARKPEQDAYDILLATVRDAIAAGEVAAAWSDRPHHVAQALWSTVHGLVALHLLLPKGSDVPLLPPGELAHAAMTACLAGFGMRPSVADDPEGVPPGGGQGVGESSPTPTTWPVWKPGRRGGSSTT